MTAAIRRRSTHRAESAPTTLVDPSPTPTHLEHRTGPVRRLGPGPSIPGALLLGPAILISVWFLGSATGFIDERTLPAPWDIGAAIADLWSDGRLQTNILASLRLASISLVIGVVGGVVLALAAGLSRLGESLIDGPIQIKRAIPTLAIIPLAIMWFGIGDTMKIIIISTSVLIPATSTPTRNCAASTSDTWNSHRPSGSRAGSSSVGSRCPARFPDSSPDSVWP